MSVLHQEPALQQELALQHKRAVARKCPCIGDSASFHGCRVCSHTRNAIPRMDPTRQPLVDHMCAWRDAISLFRKNVSIACRACQKGILCNCAVQALLLGATTVQVTNLQLEEYDLKGRIVRAANAGLTPSNIGSGARTVVALFGWRTGGPSGPSQAFVKRKLQKHGDKT